MSKKSKIGMKRISLTIPPSLFTILTTHVDNFETGIYRGNVSKYICKLIRINTPTNKEE